MSHAFDPRNSSTIAPLPEPIVSPEVPLGIFQQLRLYARRLLEITLSGWLRAALEEAQAAKEDYEGKFEKATGDEVFKYLLLINTKELTQYITQARIQADNSFRLSKGVAIAGFVLLIFGVLVGIFSHFFTAKPLEISYVTVLAGLITEFISGVFFYIYGKTLGQINIFHEKMAFSQNVSTALLTISTISGKEKSDEMKAEVSRVLSESYKKSLDAANRGESRSSSRSRSRRRSRRSSRSSSGGRGRRDG